MLSRIVFAVTLTACAAAALMVQIGFGQRAERESLQGELEQALATNRQLLGRLRSCSGLAETPAASLPASALGSRDGHADTIE